MVVTTWRRTGRDRLLLGKEPHESVKLQFAACKHETPTGGRNSVLSFTVRPRKLRFTKRVMNLERAKGWMGNQWKGKIVRVR